MALAIEIERADLILLLLAAETDNPSARFRCEGITRLEKLLFLLEKETSIHEEISESFDFEAYHYGPYSRQVYDAVEFLESLQLLTDSRIDVASGLDIEEELEALDEFDLNAGDRFVLRRLELTADGKAIAQVLSKRVSPCGKEAMTEIKRKYASMPLRQLLRYVYTQYPGYAAKSRIRDSLL